MSAAPVPPEGVERDYPAEPPDDRAHGRQRRVLRARRQRAHADRAAAPGPRCGARGARGGLGLEPAGRRRRASRGWCSSSTASSPRSRWKARADALRRRRATAGGGRPGRARGPVGDRVRRQHPGHAGRRGADERERLRRRAAGRAGVGRDRHRRGSRRRDPQRARLRLPPLRARRRARSSRGASLALARARPRGGEGRRSRRCAAAATRPSRRGSRRSARRSRTPRTRARRAAAPGCCWPRRAATGSTSAARASRPSTRTSSRTPATATTADVVAVMAEGRRRVLERFGVELEPEVQTLGDVRLSLALSTTGRGSAAEVEEGGDGSLSRPRAWRVRSDSPARPQRPRARAAAPRQDPSGDPLAPRGSPAARGLGRSARGSIAAVWRRRRARLALLRRWWRCPLLGGGWLWLRHSSLRGGASTCASAACTARRPRAIEAALRAGRPPHEHAGRKHRERCGRPWRAFHRRARTARSAELPARAADRGRRAPPRRGARSSGACARRWPPTAWCSGPAMLSTPLPTRHGRPPSAAPGQRVHGVALLPNAGRARCRARAAGAAVASVYVGPARPDGGDAQRPARLLRRRRPTAREVALARARAGRQARPARPTSTSACPRGPRRASPAASRRTLAASGANGGLGPDRPPNSPAAPNRRVAALAAGLAAGSGASSSTPSVEPAPNRVERRSRRPKRGRRGQPPGKGGPKAAPKAAGSAQGRGRRPEHANSRRLTGIKLNSRLSGGPARQFLGAGRESRDLQRTLRESTASLTGRRSLHNVHNPAAAVDQLCCKP